MVPNYRQMMMFPDGPQGAATYEMVLLVLTMTWLKKEDAEMIS